MITSAPTPADAGTPADTPLAGAPGLVAWYAEGFSDVLGDRLRLFDNAGPALELLRFSAPVASVPGLEAAVRARIDDLASFDHPAFTKVRTLKWLDDPHPQLALVSELVTGERLSTLLRAAQTLGVTPEAGSAVWMLRQLLPALAALHEASAGDGSHGLISPDRVIVTPDGALVVTEYVLGGALAGLGLAPHGTDVAQTALLALAVLLGRPLRSEESTTQLPQALDQACSGGGAAARLRPWLERAVSTGDDRFRTAREALHMLDALAIALPAAWSPALLPPGTGPSNAGNPTAGLPAAIPAAAIPTVPATTAWPTTIEGLLASLGPGDGGWRINRTLAALVTIEAICIVVLVARAAMTSTPALQVLTPPPIQAAGFVPAAPPISEVTDLLTPPPAPLAVSVPASAAGAASGPSSVVGWLVVDSDVEVKVYVNGRLLGLATRRRFGVPAGEHTITLASEDRRVRSSQAVRIVSGQSVQVTATPPAER
jgi:hypothetical protein